MYKPPKPHVPTPLEVMKIKNPKSQTKGRYTNEVKDTIKDGGGHLIKDREWKKTANPDYAESTRSAAARKDHFMKQRRLQKVI